MEVKFYKCNICGNIICKVVDSGVIPVCCGSEMELLEPHTVDNGMEKHVPVPERLDPCTLHVKVGSVQHPCTPEHYIMMIALELEDGIDIRLLGHEEGCVPETVFPCPKGKAVGVYAYCNIHGLWYAPVSEE